MSVRVQLTERGTETCQQTRQVTRLTSSRSDRIRQINIRASLVAPPAHPPRIVAASRLPQTQVQKDSREKLRHSDKWSYLSLHDLCRINSNVLHVPSVLPIKWHIFEIGGKSSAERHLDRKTAGCRGGKTLQTR